MTLDEQIDFVRAHGAQAVDEVIALAQRHREAIIEGMVTRLIGGFPDYGDASWNASEQEMLQGLMEELIDAANWRCFDIHRRKETHHALASEEDGRQVPGRRLQG